MPRLLPALAMAVGALASTAPGAAALPQQVEATALLSLDSLAYQPPHASSCLAQAGVQLPPVPVSASDAPPASCNPLDLPCQESMSPLRRKAALQEKLDALEEQDRLQARNCLGAQLDSHQKQLDAMNQRAADIRTKYLQLQRERKVSASELFKARNRVMEIEAAEKEEMAELARAEAKAAVEEHRRAIKQEEHEKKAVKEQNAKTKALEKQDRKFKHELEQKARKAAAEAAAEERARIVAERVKAAVAAAKQSVRDQMAHHALPHNGKHAAAEPLEDPVTAKLVKGKGGQKDPTETRPKIVNQLSELSDEEVASDAPKDESVTADTGDEGAKEKKSNANIVVHIGKDGVSVGREEHSEESSEESSEASEESSEESSAEESSESAAEESSHEAAAEESAPPPMQADEESAESSTEHAAAEESSAEHAAESSAEHAAAEAAENTEETAAEAQAAADF